MKNIIAVALAVAAVCAHAEAELTKAQLGKKLYFDTALSKNRTESCASCHTPGAAFTDLRITKAKGAVSRGDDGHSFGGRNAPQSAYANTIPPFHFDAKSGEYIGGQFWDGRASTLADQAGGPPLNPVEMGMPDKAAVVARLKANPVYLKAFPALFGADVFSSDDKAYLAMTQAIQSFEQTPYFSPYDSKYDRFLAGEVQLTPAEEHGRHLFTKNCAQCHAAQEPGTAKEPFSNFHYYNVGTPMNLALLEILGRKPSESIDHGLLQNPEVKGAQYDGKYRVPSLRNIGSTRPYMHNGVFHNLRTVVLFFDHFNNPKNTINPETGKAWAQPEIAANLAKAQLKAKPLSAQDVDDLVAFLYTLSDKRFEALQKALRQK